MQVARLHYESLLHGVEIDYDNSFVRFDIDEYDGSAGEVAALLRRAWNLPRGPIENLTQTIEAAGGLVVTADFGTDRVDELCQWPRDRQPFFYLNSVVSGERLRWNLAHALGHLVMHAIPGPQDEMEDQADRFAAEFLMPATEIGPDLEDLTMAKTASLKIRWRVSMQAVVNTAYHLGHITDRQRRSFFARFSKLGYRKQEPNPIPSEQPLMLQRLIEFHRSEHGYTIPDLADTVVLYPDEFERQYLLPPERPRLRAMD